MNTHFTRYTSAVMGGCLLLLGACSSDNSSYETPSKSSAPQNNNPISQKNFTLLSSPAEVAYFDVTTGSYSAQVAEISVQIGDNKNQLVTAPRTIYFRTEWGLIDPSCTTADGTCKVTWRSGSSNNVPSDLKNMIVAYSHNGQESYQDVNGNGRYDDGDTFEDLEEPYIDLDRSGTYTAGDIIIDTINGIDQTGANLQHDAADGYYNGPDCSHSTDCSPVLPSVTVWYSAALLLTTNKFSLGGTATGLTGPLVLANTSSLDLTVPADGSFTFVPSLPAGTSYNVTVKTPPTGQTCTVTNGSGVISSDVTTIAVNCI